MNPVVLGGVIKNFYENFDIKEFGYRFKLQKITYLLKSRGFNLGYNFSLYLYGPYSPDLTRDIFQLFDITTFDKIQRIVPTDKKEEFDKFIEMMNINERKNDDEWLEVVASYLFLKANGVDDNDIVRKMKQKRDGFSISDDRIRQIISEIKTEGYFVS